MNVEVDPTEDTEWNDILRAHGIIPPRPPSPTAELEKALEDAVQKAHDNRLEDRTLEELNELDEDGLEDEDFIREYQMKRIREMQSQAAREKYGDLVTISRKDYQEEITETSAQTHVFVHIMSPGITQCKLLTGLFQVVAAKFRELKFVQIDARQINEHYPTETCPTILVYKDKDVVQKYVTLAQLGGNSTSIRDIERMLVHVKAVETKDRRLLMNGEDEDENERPRNRVFERFD